MPSNAVGSELISKIVGYKITKGNFSEDSPNLPMRVAILAEANFANQGSLNLDARELTTAKKAGELYGYGSPIYTIMRILRPVNGGGIGGIPVVVYPQAMPVGATAKVLHITPTGTATANGTHQVVIGGRNGVDGQSYAVNIAVGDDVDAIVEKISDVINSVLGSPVIGTFTTGVGAKTIATSKWKGLTADDITITVDTGDKDLGVTYAVTSSASGAGTPSLAGALAQFQEDWNTIVINSYGTQSDVMDELEAFNGIADPDSPTGRYTGIIMKPFVALTGTTEADADTLVAITDPRALEMTIVGCPAPNSAGLPMESAAAWGLQLARQAQDNPQLDLQSATNFDIPTPINIGDMNDYLTRDRLVKAGCSTVEKIAGKYKVCDLVTTYHPDGEIPSQFNYVRNLIIDWNIRFGVYLLEQINVVDHVIASDNDIVNAQKVIKPKQWRLILNNYAESLAKRGLIADAAFMQESIIVNISSTNPNRLETFFRYKRTGFGRVVSTTAEAGFNFGTNN